MGSDVMRTDQCPGPAAASAEQQKTTVRTAEVSRTAVTRRPSDDVAGIAPVGLPMQTQF